MCTGQVGSGTMKNILIIGASGHAWVVADIVELQGLYRVVGLIALSPAGESKNGYEIIGRIENLPELVRRHAVEGFIAGVGDNAVRSRIVQTASELCPGLELVRAVHPSSVIARSALLGAGSVIMAGAIVNPAATVGRGCILNTGSSLDHDSVMQDFSSLAPGAHVGGNCQIGAGSAICIGASVRHGIRIGAHSVLGAGATALHDVPALSVAYGTPARVIRSRSEGDRYL